MLNILNRNKSYFQALRDNKVLIESYNVDSQYKEVIDYLNDSVVPAINSIVDEALPGILGNANSYLKNVGDGTTTWATIDQGIKSYSLSLSKLIKVAVGSVLVSDGSGEITSVSTVITDQVLVSQGGSTPIWKKIQTTNIGDGEITAANIADGAIGREHLKLDVIVSAIPNGFIRGGDFVDQSLTSIKFANASIDSSKLGIVADYINIGNFYQFGGPIKKQHVQNNTITSEKFSEMSVERKQFNKVRCVTVGKIAANTINDSFLLTNYLQPDATAESFFAPDSLAQNFKLTTSKLGNNTDINGQLLSQADFEPEVAAAFRAKECM